MLYMDHSPDHVKQTEPSGREPAPALGGRTFMCPSRQDPCRQEAVHQDARGGVTILHLPTELDQVLEPLAARMTAAGYSERDVFAVRLAMEEALVNAIKHGNGGDPGKEVRVSYEVTDERVLAEVEDQGPGFDPTSVPDPLLPENMERPCGRGLLLIRAYMTWVRYNDRGNRVTLCKNRSA
jgi:serine/threonine-protein kinase RsbW